MEASASRGTNTRSRSDAQGEFPGIGRDLERIDNITDTALLAFRESYNDNTITKDAIFDYVYGVLHAPAYRKRFANDLVKELPRIPFAADFHAFAAAGHELAAASSRIRDLREVPLGHQYSHSLGEPRAEHFRIGERAMRFSDDEKTIFIVNDHIRLERNSGRSTSVPGQWVGRRSSGSSTATRLSRT